MVVFILIIILAIVATSIGEAVRKSIDRKGWIRGDEFERDVYGDISITARLIADSEKREFTVRYDVYDGHFYDTDNTGYHATEIYLKKQE